MVRYGCLVGDEECVVEVDIDPVAVMPASVEGREQTWTLVNTHDEVDVAVGSKAARGVAPRHRRAFHKDRLDPEARCQLQNGGEAPIV